MIFSYSACCRRARIPFCLAFRGAAALVTPVLQADVGEIGRLGHFSLRTLWPGPFFSGCNSPRAVSSAATPAATTAAVAVFFATCLSFDPALRTEVFLDFDDAFAYCLSFLLRSTPYCVGP